MTKAIFSRQHLLELGACTACGLCAVDCPAVLASRDGRLSGVYRLEKVRKNILSRRGWGKIFGRKPLTPEELRQFGDTVFKCTLCGRCEEVCPLGLGLKDLYCAIRQDMVGCGAYPEKIDFIRDNLEESHNVFGEDNEERADWVDDLPDPPDDKYIKEQADIVYFTGCVASFFPLAQKGPMAAAEILGHFEVDFTLLGEEEWCCGFPLLGAGLGDRAAAMAAHNLKAVADKKATKVVLACPSCYQMWREHYPAGPQLIHLSELFRDLVVGRPDLLRETPLKVAFHDPCDLGRGARIFEAPREVLRAIPGIELLELEHNREDCRCCGGGGNLEMTAPELSVAITRDKIEEILKTGAEAVVTSCQQCVRTMTSYVRKNKVPLEVLDLSQVVRMALDI
ncbi:MAG: (Fe-S)-binding protein [Pseudomonadota bacterium]